MSDNTDEPFDDFDADRLTPGELLEVAIRDDDALAALQRKSMDAELAANAAKVELLAAEGRASIAANALRCAMQAAGVEALLRGGVVYYVTAAGLTRRRL